jgi:hypothetical protein
MDEPRDYSPDGPLAFVETATFRIAKSVPEDPHEYVVRRALDWPDREAYDLFCRAIVEHGDRLPFQWDATSRVQHYHYLRIGEWWCWEAPRGLVNRKRRGWERMKFPGWWNDATDVAVQPTLL